MADHAPSARTGNLLLDAIPPDVREILLINAKTQSIDPGAVLVDIGDEVRSAFFPTSGTVSILAEPDDESTVEASSVGREGTADAFAALGALKSAHRLIGQVPGEMIVIEAKVLVDQVSQPGRTQELFFSYIQALYGQAAASAACNAKHRVEQRAARWLLQTHDRVDSDTFLLKQEFLAYMLGVTRPSVSIAANTLQAAGLIRYRRGNITVVDREGLEGAACACYEYVRKQYSELIEL